MLVTKKMTHKDHRDSKLNNTELSSEQESEWEVSDFNFLEDSGEEWIA